MQVLDNGYVELVDVMGDDHEPARAARISYGNYDEVRDWETDAKLTRYLWTHKHTSPFEQVELKFKVKAPIFVARQWLRHRTANVNEISYRYTEAPDEFYIPEHFREQSTTNRQNSGEPIRDGGQMVNDYLHYVQHAREGYERLLDGGASREMARMALPVSQYTQFVWKNDLHNTLHFLRLRTATDAGWEIRQYSLAMVHLIKERLPKLMEIVWD